MRILISAFACEPHMGSEPEAGLQAVLAAASEHEVWVITRQNHIPRLDEYLDEHPLRDRIHTVGFDVDGLSRKVEKRIGLVSIHWHHDVWQRRLAEVAASLADNIDFDLVHHATYAAYWTRTGLAAVDKPLVWGPVGGGVTSPLGLLPIMGLRGAIGDLIRSVSRPMAARVFRARRTARRAAVVIVQNPETARIIKRTETAIVLPNALAAAKSVPQIERQSTDDVDHPRIVTAGRLVGWKGTMLAVAAMRHVHHPRAVLEIYGDGPQRHRLELYAQKIGVAGRVKVMGQVTREDLLKAISEASALVHPSLHEEAGFVVAEALALATPVVCLDRGGPPVLARAWESVPSRAIQPARPRETARRIGTAIDEVIGERGEPGIGPTPSYAEGLLAAYELSVKSNRG